jgi:hypothetical protein
MSEFQSRLLYTQSSRIQHEDNELNVSSTIYAIKYLYPGATQSTTSRIRITCTYKDIDRFEAHAGVIERWSDKGWMFVDDYTGAVYAFISAHLFRKRLLDYAHAFIMGVPLDLIDAEYVPSLQTGSAPISKKPYNPNKRKPKVTDDKNKTDNYKIEESKSKDDDDDDDDSEDFYL